MKTTRLVLGTVGGAVAAYGVYRLSHLPSDLLLLLGLWLLGAVVVHHGVVSPLVLAVGAGLRRYVPDRARGVVQGGLIAAAGVTVISLPLIHREGTQPASKAMLLQSYGANVALLLGAVAVASLIAYAIRVARDRPGA